MINKIGLLGKVFLLYATPFKAIGCKLGFLRGIQKLRMRNRQEFLIRAGTTDISVINEIYIKKLYDEALLKRPLAPTIIDIGANIGAFSMRAVNLCHRPTIYAFEPFSQNFQLLQRNVGLNNLQDTIHSIPKAITKDGKPRYLNIQQDREGASTLHADPSCKYQLKEKVQSIKLGEFMDSHKLKFIDLLKLDCEGAEFEILHSLDKSHFKKIKRIVLEYHEYFGTGKAEELTAFLEKQGYKVKLDYTGALGMMLAENSNKQIPR